MSARGGSGLEGCAVLANHEFERIFYKNNFGFGIRLFNIVSILDFTGHLY